MREEHFTVGPKTPLEGMVVAMRSQAKARGLNPAEIELMIEEILEQRLWEGAESDDGRPLSLHRLLFDPDGGAGLPEDALLSLLRDRNPDLARALHREIDQPLPEHGEIGRGRERDRGDNITSTDRGTSDDYTRRRLRRDRPDLYERVVEGELSANAAAIEAGFRRPTASVPVDSPESAIRALMRRFTAEELLGALEDRSSRVARTEPGGGIVTPARRGWGAS